MVFSGDDGTWARAQRASRHPGTHGEALSEVRHNMERQAEVAQALAR